MDYPFANEIKEIKSHLKRYSRLQQYLNYEDVQQSIATVWKRYPNYSSGAYATVFRTTNRNYVIKILDVETDSLNPYRSYISFCKRYADKYENLPIIYDTFQIRGYFFVVMEKLVHNTHRSRKFHKEFFEYDDDNELLVSKFNPKSFILKRIAKIANEYGWPIDLAGNEDNIMFRNGVPVITDPIG